MASFLPDQDIYHLGKIKVKVNLTARILLIVGLYTQYSELVSYLKPDNIGLTFVLRSVLPTLLDFH